MLRYFNVFGPRQSPYSQYAAVVPLFLTAIAAGEPMTIFGDGEQSRDFTYVGNVVDANLRAADAPAGRTGGSSTSPPASPASVNARRRDDRRARSASRSSGATSRRAPATSATPGPTSRPRGRCSAGSRRSSFEDGLRRTADIPCLAEPIRVLRVIARLNMGGPALHVAYLSAGLAERGYETTLVAGSLARGEGSMAYVAEELGVEIVKLDALLARDLAGPRRALGASARAPDPRAAAADPAHAHGEGRHGGARRGAPRRRRPAADRRPHVPRPRPPRLLRPGQVAARFACSSGCSRG